MGRYGAELIVVFVGVWLGLLAENLREDRRDRTDEAVSLRRLAEDLGQAGRDMAYNLGVSEEGALAARRLLELDPSSTPVDTVEAHLCQLRATTVLAARAAEYRSLIGSGRIGIIRDEELRRGLTELYEYLPVIALIHEREERMVTEAMRAIQPHVHVGMGTDASPCVTLSGTPEDVLRAPGFGHAAQELATARDFLARRYRQLVSEARRLEDLAQGDVGHDEEGA